jgi:hypothetical protein
MTTEQQQQPFRMPRVPFDYPVVYWMSTPADERGYLAWVMSRNEQNLTLMVVMPGGMDIKRASRNWRDPELLGNTQRSQSLLRMDGCWRSPEEEELAHLERDQRAEARLRAEQEQAAAEHRAREAQLAEHELARRERLAKEEALLREREAEALRAEADWDRRAEEAAAKAREADEVNKAASFQAMAAASK